MAVPPYLGLGSPRPTPSHLSNPSSPHSPLPPPLRSSRSSPESPSFHPPPPLHHTSPQTPPPPQTHTHHNHHPPAQPPPPPIRPRLLLPLLPLVALWLLVSCLRPPIPSSRASGSRAPRPSPPRLSSPPAPPTTAFVLNFESSSGSSWLIQELAAHPEVCAILFEPIDNISLASAADHVARLRWLETLWTPPSRDAPAASWEAWRGRLEGESVFGQLPRIRESLRRCSASSVAFGLKARLSRLLTHDAAMDGLRALMQRRGVRLIRLSRRNRVKQALAEYRRLHAGLGQFRVSASAGGSSSTAIAVRLPLFRQCLQAVERSHRLAERVLARVAGQPLLALAYETLFAEHTATLGRVADFLGIARWTTTPGDGAPYSKATPDRLCAAVANYAELCGALSSRAEYAGFFDEPCRVAGCGAAAAAAAASKALPSRRHPARRRE